MSETDAQYDALTTGVGIVDLSDRTKLELTGDDRASFLHNLCTNQVRELLPGSGCETFFTNVQGKVLGHALVFVRERSIVVDTVPGQSDTLLPHFDRYLIREDVQLVDRTDDWGELLVAGAGAAALLKSVCENALPAGRLDHVDGQILGVAVVIARVDMAGDGYLVQCDRAAIAAISDALVAHGAVLCAEAAFETVRIENGWPLYGRDITSENLPQEVDRNEQAISFTKGCYLGQETVARIDALGHVNRTLCGLRFDGEAVPRIGTDLSVEDKVVGRVTSAAFSPKLDAPLALAYLRRGNNVPGQAVGLPPGGAVVIPLPV